MRSDAWWIDHLESEDAPWNSEQVDLIMKHSVVDGQIIFNLHRLKMAALDLDDIPALVEQVDFEALHSRIMRAVASSDPHLQSSDKNDGNLNPLRTR